MLPSAMSTSALPWSMAQPTASLCGGLSTSGPTENHTAAQSSSSDESKQLAYTIGIYMGPVIFFIGLIGNVLILAVMSTKRMRGTSTSDYLIIMAVADLLTITIGIIPDWLEAMGIFVLQAWNPAMCKIYKFVNYAVGDTATWIRVLFTLDRFMAICFPMKKTDCCLAWRAKYYCLGAALAAIAKNMHVFWTRGAQYQTQTVYEYVDCVQVPTNMTTTSLVTNCGYPTPEYQYFETYVRPWIVFALVNFIPFCIILVCNIFIVRAMISMTRMRKEQRLPTKSSDWQLFQTTAMCLGASFTFLICITPTMVLLIGKPYWTMNGPNTVYEIAKTVSNQLLYLNNSVNFFLYCITGKKFRETLGLILRCRCKDVMGKSDATSIAGRPGSVAAVVSVASVMAVRGDPNGRQSTKPGSYLRQGSGQSVSFQLPSLSQSSSVFEDEIVVVQKTDVKTTVVDMEEGIVMEDVVMTQLVESIGEAREEGRDQTSTRKRTGSESSSGVSSATSTSNADQSPTALSSTDADGTGSPQTGCASTNQGLTSDLKDQSQAEEGSRHQGNAMEHSDTRPSCMTVSKDCSVEDHILTPAVTSDGDLKTDHSLLKNHGLAKDQSFTKDHGLANDHGFAEDYGLAKDRDLGNGHGSTVTQYLDIIHPEETNSSVNNQMNTISIDSCKCSPVKTKTTSSLNTDNNIHHISLESETKTSQTSWKEQDDDLDKLKTDNSYSIGIVCENSKRCDVNTDAVSSEQLEKITQGEDALSGNAERKSEIVNKLEFHGIGRQYTKDELLDILPQSFC